MGNKLFEHETERTLTREEAAKVLRELADTLERRNQIELTIEGRDMTVSVADEVELEVEVEVASEAGKKSELEVSIAWRAE